MSDTALVIVDMQNDFVSPDVLPANQGAFAVVPKIKQLLEHFRAQNLKVFYIVRDYRLDGTNVEFMRVDSFLQRPRAIKGTSGYEIFPDIAPLDGEYIINKCRFSAFMGTEFDFILRRLAIKNLVVCGTQLPNCVRTTVYDAIAMEYRVTVITDASAARTEEVHKANIVDLVNVGVPCVSVNEYIKHNFLNVVATRTV